MDANGPITRLDRCCDHRVVLVAAWNSLEAAKLVVAVLTPLLVAVVGFAINRSVRRLEDAQWANRRLIERRLELYDEIAPRLNDLYCFFRLVGRFREIEPPRALALKHELDKLFHVNRYLFDPGFLVQYQQFIDCCFRTFTGTGELAKIRSPIVLQREERRQATWDPVWESLFDPEIQPPVAAGDPRASLTAAYHAQHELLSPLHSAYNSLMASFADAVGARS